jgi:hypothetical protein
LFTMLSFAKMVDGEVSVTDEWNVSVEDYWKDTDKRRPKYLEKNMSYCLFGHHKSHMEWPGIELGPW